VLLVTLALKTLLSISQNGMDQITLNKTLGNHSNMDIINASSPPKKGKYLVSLFKHNLDTLARVPIRILLFGHMKLDHPKAHFQKLDKLLSPFANLSIL
jgi:hypothetical protein